MTHVRPTAIPPARRRNDKTPEQDARILPEHLQQAREMLLQDPHAGWKLLHATLQRGERIRDFEFGILTKGRLLTLSLSGRRSSTRRPGSCCTTGAWVVT